MANNPTEIEKRLWASADELRANSKLKSSDYSVPVSVLGLIFLRCADHRLTQAEKEMTSQGIGHRAIGKEDYEASQSFLNSDAAVLGLNRNQSFRNPFVLPSEDALNFFEEKSRNLFSELRNLRKRNDNLRTTRGLLLLKLISGQLGVEELGIKTGEMAEECEETTA